MSRFRITIDDRIVASLHGPTWRRLSAFLERRFSDDHPDGEKAAWWGRIDTPTPGAVTYTGDAPDDVIAVLQAVARGDDIAAVLDMIGPPTIPQEGPQPPAPAGTQEETSQ